MNETIYLSPVNDKWTVWKLIKDYTVEVNGRKITIPKGFKTDFASVPRFLWNLIPPFGRYGIPAIVHDYLYYSCELPKKEADEIFYRLMLERGVPKLKAYLMYIAVRLFGRMHCGKMVDELEE